ncbi:RING finger domain-containing protein [Endozoicomonas acroporae]|uniref:RING finger domain-containing protein n=1 Tax=Endozoicomonas acroporae TaxID=1701104 RepID=UPI000C777179|nr:RING finger domain-containing protein [Endozoicomonas acroporae]
MNGTSNASCRYYQPTTEYQKDDGCIICYSDFAGKEVSVTKCAHLYHTSCLETWLKHGDVCPVCRTPLKERATQPEDSVFNETMRNVRTLLEVAVYERGGAAVNALIAVAGVNPDENDSAAVNSLLLLEHVVRQDADGKVSAAVNGLKNRLL